MSNSRPDFWRYYVPESTNLGRDYIKELFQSDEAVVINGKGVVIAAGRYITIDASMI